MKRKFLKGFTLVEMIIVIAIFAVLMTGALALVDPVSRINKSSSDFEKTYAYVDNIQDYLKSSVQYADNMWIIQGDKTADDLRDLAFDYKEAFYKNILSSKNGGKENYSDCTIRVMTILNKDTNIGGVDYPKGQILMQSVTYSSDAISKIALPAAEKQLNDIFFTDKYKYDYVISACGYNDTSPSDSIDPNSLVKTGNNVMINNMSPDKVGEVAANITPSNLGVGIVVYDTSKNRDGSARFTDVSAQRDSDNADYVYRTYEPSTKYSIANIPLLNIIRRNGSLNKSYYVYGQDSVTFADDKTRIINYPGENFDPSYVPPSSLHSAFEHSELSMSCNDNIYIIYSLTDEVNVPK